LHKKKLLYKDSRSGKWSWDLYDVTSVITSSNVVDVIIVESANKLPKQAKSLLLLAACMGSTCIDEDMLFLIWSKFERKSRANFDVQSQFRLFINESLYRKILVKVEHPSVATHRAYHWAHESMIKALSGHADSNNIASLRYEIGSTLNYVSGEKADPLALAKLINSGGNSLLGSLDSKKRVKWAEKNLMAAKKAVLMSAFEAAAQYAEAGIEYLPSNRRWKEHCKLMLELSSILAEVAGALGKFLF
jgi:predicted ATPase